MCTLLAGVALAGDDVVVGTKDNFKDLIAKDELTFVKFYAPWCGHCKAMAADFKEAATELKGKAVLADVDATVEKELAKEYGVRGFPTLKLFSKGELVADYKGGRKKDELIKYIERAMLPSVTECENEEAVKSFAEGNEGKALFFGVKLDKLSDVYTKLSMSLRDSMSDAIAVGSVGNAALLKEYSADLGDDSILVVRQDKSVDVYTGDSKDLEGWMKMAALPLFGELNRKHGAMYTELDKPLFILFQDPKKKKEDLNKDIAEISKVFRDRNAIAFAWIDIVELKSFAQHVGVAKNDPAIAIYSFDEDVKFVFTEKYSAESLKAWIEKFLAGGLTPSMKSEPIPEKNDEPVKVVVGDTWKDIVEDESKDVLIEQYAPWCGHCKKLAPVLDKLASQLSSVETLVIAKMDATANDAPEKYKAKGYPSIRFFPAGKSEGISYQGGRTLEDFIELFKKNATHKEGLGDLTSHGYSESSEGKADREKEGTKEEL